MLALVDPVTAWTIVPFVFGILIFSIAMVIVPVVFLWRALDRAGLAAPLALLWFIPFGQIVVLGILAYSEWPALRQR